MGIQVIKNNICVSYVPMIVVDNEMDGLYILANVGMRYETV